MQGRRFQRAPFKVVRKDVEAEICFSHFLCHKIPATLEGGANVYFANCDIRLVNYVEAGSMNF